LANTKSIYVYDKDALARNHEAYQQRNEIIAAPAVHKLIA